MSEKASGWFMSAQGIMKTAKSYANSDPCRAIVHYSDAIAEGTVAAVLADQSGNSALAKRGDRLTRSASRQQQAVINLCKRSKR